MYQCEANTINGVLQYLSTKPYMEVEALVQALRAGKMIDEDAAKTEDKAPEIITEA